MTGITSIRRDWGDNVCIVRIITTDTLNSALAANYILNQLVNITAANEGAFTWLTNDQILLSAADGNVFGSISANLQSIVPASVLYATQLALTALAGGGQTGATALKFGINQFSTVATTGNSAILPASVLGQEVIVVNNGANSMNVFPASGDTINSGSANAAVAVAAGAQATFKGVSATNWLETVSTPGATGLYTNAVNTMAAGGEIILDKGTGTVSAGAVTINKQSGVITTTSLSTATNASATVTLTNSEITTSSVIVCQIQGGTNTTPGITIVATPGAGSATIVLYNGGVGAAALNGTVIFSFVVF
jgi:hypothetical protein